LDPETRERIAVRGFNALTRELRHVEKPIIAAVNGPAVGGGCCIALAADVRIASSQASFGLVFIRVGLAAADMGATFLLPRLVGLGCASELLLSGDTVDAERAERIGMVNRVVPPDGLLAEAQELAARIAAGPPVGVAMTKRALNRSLGMDIDEHLDYEAYIQSKCMMTEDHREGVEAFLAKRAPHFRGR
jgi:2-(1,2-epoxy-1,2-dihydrophenyl)acetyl-CoA isomerase